MISLTNKRYVCWDMDLVEKNDRVNLNQHKPVRKNIVLTCDKLWEGVVCGYMSTVKVGDTYRIYYRAAGPVQVGENKYESNGVTICVIESKDGKTFTRPNIGRYEHKGSFENNIVLDEGRYIDNFSVYYDENPDCPPDEKFKGLSMLGGEELAKFRENIMEASALAYYKSADGYKFERVGIMGFKGAFDSLNHVLWDPEIKKYRAYFRGNHLSKYVKSDNRDLTEIRDIRVAESEDFVNWSEPVILEFENSKYEHQLYTNGITKYHRADIYYGMSTRYINHVEDVFNYKYMPSLGGRRQQWIDNNDRSGTAITDVCLLTSRDGINFRRIDEAFMTPGIQTDENWVYGDCFVGRGMIETESDYPGEPNELSIYTSHGYRQRNLDLVRYTVRLDGLLSWGADYEGGSILTKPLTFTGEKLSINFETSCFGHVRIKICDENGEPIEGYDSGTVFGNTVNRPVDFEKDLRELCGKTVRLNIELKDAELYSFIFE